MKKYLVYLKGNYFITMIVHLFTNVQLRWLICSNSVQNFCNILPILLLHIFTKWTEIFEKDFKINKHVIASVVTYFRKLLIDRFKIWVESLRKCWTYCNNVFPTLTNGMLFDISHKFIRIVNQNSIWDNSALKITNLL